LQASKSDEEPELMVSFAWRANALRHSYRGSVIKNAPQLAEGMGNSVTMIQQNYGNPRPKSQAKQWFAIMPPRAANVVEFRHEVAYRKPHKPP
jgi:hypothetical protein